MLRTSVNTTVTWRKVAIPPHATLILEAAVDQGHWTTNNGPIDVRITAVVNGVTHLDTQQILITAEGTLDRLVQSLDLSAHSGQALSLTFTAQGETRNSARMVIWSGLKFE